jgi:hypothetical protein
MTPARTTATWLSDIDRQLTERDRDVIALLSRVRIATTKQIERVGFVDSTAGANARASRRVLTKLEQLGLVARLGRRVGGVRAGSAGLTWSLGVTGQHFANRFGPAGADRRSPWTPSQPYLAHHVAVTEVFVRLREAQVRGEGELLAFDTEPACWRRFIGPSSQRLTLKPDAYVVTATAAFEDSAFLEVDLGSESPSVLRRKVAAYLAYRRTGREEREHGVYPLVVFIVPNERRAAAAAQVLAPLPTSDLALFRVVLSGDSSAALMGGTP